MSSSAVSNVLAVLRAPIEPSRKNLGWVVMFLMSLFVLRYVEIPYLDPHNSLRPHHIAIRWLLGPHIAGGLIALLSGGAQFSSRLRGRYTGAHRVLGRLYAVAVLIAAPCAIAIPIHLQQHRYYIAGTIVHAGTWFVTTLVAFTLARKRQIAQHRQWMIRSYAFTFSFIMVRVFSKFVPLDDPDFGMFDATMTLVVLLATDLGINWQQLFGRSRPASP